MYQNKGEAGRGGFPLSLLVSSLVLRSLFACQVLVGVRLERGKEVKGWGICLRPCLAERGRVEPQLRGGGGRGLCSEDGPRVLDGCLAAS